MKISAETIITKTLKVAALPAVALKFSEAISNPLTSNLELEKIISEDSALASRLLRIANSALYNFPSEIDTIGKAITIIGQKPLHDIVLSCSIVNMFDGITKDVINMEQFWEHSIAVATASRLLSFYRREVNIERSFTAGLLHDIGRLIIFIELPKQAQEIISIAASKNTLLHSIELDVLGFDHARLGGMLLKKWKLPDRIISSVSYHHSPTATKGDVVAPSIVHVADIICHSLKLGRSGERFIPKLNSRAWDTLGLNADILAQLIEQLDIQYQDAVKFILGEDNN